jgi:hypothetical protein
MKKPSVQRTAQRRQRQIQIPLNVPIVSVGWSPAR